MLTAADAATVGTFVDLGYDEEIIEEIKRVLDTGANDLNSGKHLPTTSAGSYGSSPASLELARNAALAREKVIEAITDMAAGLRGFRTSVEEFHLRTQNVESDAHASFASIKEATACIAQPTIASPSQCTAPGASGGDR